MSINPLFIQLIDSYKSPLLHGLTESLESSAPSVSIRLNPRKGGAEPVGGERVAWSSDGWYLPSRPEFTLDPSLHQGRYYVQEASSMIVGEIVRRLTENSRGPLVYLDACAAPGGKTTAAIDALPEGSLVVANEYVPKRAAILAENLTKWGYPNIAVSRGDTSRFRKLAGMFDLIGVDAPCSGEGMFRKDAEAVAQWSPALVAECSTRQWEIISNLWGALKAGGYLIYSTCTFNRQENEDIAERIVNELGAESVDLKLPDEWGISPGIGTKICCYRFLPHRLRGEGLFVAVVRKPSEDIPIKERGIKAGKEDKTLEPLREWLKNGDRYMLERNGDSITAVDKTHASTVAMLRQGLDIIRHGIELATIKGRDYAPTHTLAMSTEINLQSFPSVEVNKETALSYLRREGVALPAGIPKGYVLITYGNRPLGFVKNIGNRANILYPLNWRILKR